jgi:hypothetical protein
VFVSVEPAKNVAIGAIERAVGTLKRSISAFVEPDLRLIGAVHTEGLRRGDRKKDGGG